jgi:hypothetical protein
MQISPDAPMGSVSSVAGSTMRTSGGVSSLRATDQRWSRPPRYIAREAGGAGALNLSKGVLRLLDATMIGPALFRPDPGQGT